MSNGGFDDEATFEVDDDLLDEVRAEAAQHIGQGQADLGNEGTDDVPVIDGYQELREIGRGGFSRVYEALQVEFDRWVAIKVLNERIIDSGHIAEFERECRLMGNLSRHPNIVTVHASAFSHDLRPCIVMELFSHGSYQNILNLTGPLALEELLSLSVQMAGALATAHQRGVIHGDVKPQNILRSEFNTPALGDFGIAALVDTAGDTNKLRASVHYAAPELIEKGPSASSPAADQYSLAATIYTLATGQRPHAGDGSQSTRELFQRVLVEPAPRLEGGYPADFANILQKAMSREPQERHRDLVAFAAAIATTQQQLGLQPTDIPVGTQQARYVAATPEPAPSQTLPGSPSSGEGHTESTMSLAARQDQGSAPPSPVSGDKGPPDQRQSQAHDQMPAQPPKGPGNGRRGLGSFWGRSPGWVKALATVVVIAAVALVGYMTLLDSEGDDNTLQTASTSDAEPDSSPTQTPNDNAAPDPTQPTLDAASQDQKEGLPSANVKGVGEPSVSGEALVGETLKADISRISDKNGLDGVSFAYEWILLAADGTVVAATNEVGPNYMVSDADVGLSIRVNVSYFDQDGYFEGPLTSTPTAPVLRPNASPEGQPLISGETWVGEVVTAVVSWISDGNGIEGVPFTYNWVRVAPNGTTQTIAGESSAAYMVTTADIGHSIRVDVSFIDQDGYSEGPLQSPTIATRDQIALHSNRNSTLDIFVANSNGTNQRQLTKNEGNNFDPSLSPDSTKIAFTSDRFGNHEIYVMDVDGSNQLRLTNNSSTDGDAAWSPDGTEIVFTTNRYGNYELAVISADGSTGENARRLTRSSSQERSPAWSGSKIAYIHNFGGDFEIAVMNDDGSGVRTLTSNRGDDEAPAWSNDSSKIAYARGNPTPGRVNDFDITIMNADGSDKNTILNTSTTEKAPTWSPDGSKIAFHSIRSNGDIEIWVVDANGDNSSRLIDSPGSGRDWVGSWR